MRLPSSKYDIQYWSLQNREDVYRLTASLSLGVRITASDNLQDTICKQLKFRGATIVRIAESDEGFEPTIIYASSGSGKSFYSGEGGRIDGDRIIASTIGWPVEKDWWKGPGPYVTNQDHSYSTRHEYERALAFQIEHYSLTHPWYIVYFVAGGPLIHEHGLNRSYAIVSQGRHIANWKRRMAVGADQPRDVKDLRALRIKDAKWARLNKLLNIDLPGPSRPGISEADIVVKDWVEFLELDFEGLHFSRSGQELRLRRQDHAYSSLSYLSLLELWKQFASAARPPVDAGSTPEKYKLAISYGHRIIPTNVFRTMPYNDDTEAALVSFDEEKIEEGIGQKKLFWMDAYLLLQFPDETPLGTVVYIGGSPGQHMRLLQKAYDLQVYNYDSTPPHYRCHWISELYTPETCLPPGMFLISDIRRDRRGVSDSQWELWISEDNDLTYQMPFQNYTYWRHKFRLSRSETRRDLKGVAWCEPYLWNLSFEVSVIGKSFELPQRREMNWSLLKKMRTMRKAGDDAIVDGLFFDRCQLLDIRFNPSDIANFVMTRLERKYQWVAPQMFNIPIAYSGEFEGSSYNISSVAYLTKGSHRGATLAQLRNLLPTAFLGPDPHQEWSVKSVPWGASLAEDRWYWFIPGPEPKVQTPEFSQTRYVHWMSSYLRLQGYQTSELYRLRRAILLLLFEEAKMVWTEKGWDQEKVRISPKSRDWMYRCFGINVRSVKAFYDVKMSGHLLGLLLSSVLAPVNLYAYMWTLQCHILEKTPSEYEIEKTPEWHESEEWLLAVMAYPPITKILKVPFNYPGWLVCVAMLIKTVRDSRFKVDGLVPAALAHHARK
jgi:hypothetical protein